MASCPDRPRINHNLTNPRCINRTPESAGAAGRDDGLQRGGADEPHQSRQPDCPLEGPRDPDSVASRRATSRGENSRKSPADKPSAICETASYGF